MDRAPHAPQLDTLLATQREAYRRDPYPDRATRLDRLARLESLLRDGGDRIAQAISADFGNRSVHETVIAEIFFVQAGIAHTCSHLRKWMKQRRVATSFHSLPGSSRILPQPLGVVGIVSPWNYPLQLALAPAVAALAAGNRVMIKPSELTPRLSALLAELVGARFGADEMAVVEGDAEVGKAFTALRFDHLFFTGSTQVGRIVAQAAAANLVPVTLELGGKSPAIIDPSADLDEAAARIAAGKLFNAGQTCIAPDYVLVPTARREAFAQAFLQAARRMYPALAGNPDYTTIVSERHYQRLERLVDQAAATGARVLRAEGHAAQASTRVLPPTVLLDARDDQPVMQEEIFGPVLPVVGYEQLDEAIGYINARPRPLALYLFGSDSAAQERVLTRTVSGGVTVNDCLLHIAQENLPFGGVGDSGIGSYHGEHGFRLFSKDKPIFVQSRFAGTALLRPPYGPRTERVIGLLKKLV